MLSVLIGALTAQAEVHVFKIDGTIAYKGSATGSTIIKGPYFMGNSYTVIDAMTLSFATGGSTKTNKIVTTGDDAYGTLFQRNQIKITPVKDMAITKVRIGTVNDLSQGFVDDNDKALSRSGSVYEWTGEATSAMKLKVISDEANNNLGFTYVEVTYGKEFGSAQDPNPGQDPDPGKDPNQGQDPNPGQDPVKIGKVTISPTTDLISPTQTIEISCETEGTTIYYTTNGTRPNKNAPQYMRPFRLSLATGMTVRALATTDDGQTAEAQTHYYFDRVSSIADFFANGSTIYPVDLIAPLQLIIRNGATAYMLDTSAPTAEYLCVSDPGLYLRSLTPGKIVDGLVGIVDNTASTVALELSERPIAVGSSTLPAADTVKLSSLTEADINRFVALKGAKVTSRGTVTQGSNSIALDDIFDVVTKQVTEVEATVSGFVALSQTGSLALRPTKIEPTKSTDPDPVNPEEPTGETSSVSATSIGDGRLEIFPGYNKYTLTPEGDLIALPAKLAKGSTVYLYFPDSKTQVASLVAGTTILAGDSEEFTSTPYGQMLPLKITGDLTIVVTFIASTGIDDINADRGHESWYDLSGRKLPSRPTQPGLYIRKKLKKTEIVRVC